jgi:1-deoxyxylulose-5-phosphate synthase
MIYNHLSFQTKTGLERKMEYRQLGRSGMRVSKLCLGTMVGFTSKNEAEAKKIIDEALDSGVNFIDTADCYGESEDIVGKALAETGKREKAVLATKFGWFMGKDANDYGSGRKHMISACEKSLRRLKTDYIDLYILHVVDPNTPMDELLYTFDILVRQGKVRYIGTSKHPVSLILEGVFTSEKYNLPRFVSEQPPYSLLDRRPENELVPACKKHGVGITPFYPLASGLLSGKYRKDAPPPEGGRMSRKTPGSDEIYTMEAADAIEKLIPLAEGKGLSLAEFSLAWLMQAEGVASAILGARKLEYLRSGIKACEVSFSEEELKAVDEIVPPGGFVSNYLEANVYRPLRLGYSSSARRLRGTGAYIPATETFNPEEDFRGRRKR